MIDIARLRPPDVGRGVIYTPSAGKPERGVLSSWNDKYIFARFTSGSTAAACDPADLTWEFDRWE